MHKSIDGGESWQEIKIGLEDQEIIALALNPKNPEIIYAGTRNKIFKSVDGGNLWFHLSGYPEKSIFKNIYIDNLNPANIYAETLMGLCKSTSGGDSWFEVNSNLNKVWIVGLSENKIEPLMLYGTEFNHRVLYKSTDGAENWSVVYDFKIDWFVHSLTVDPVNSANLYLSYSDSADENGLLGGIMISTDEGKNWFRPLKQMPVRMVKSITVDPQNPTCLYAATTGGVYKSVDKGFNWINMSNGLDGFGANYIFIDPVNTSVIYTILEGYRGIYKSINGGESWKYIGFAGLKVCSFAIDPINSSNIYVAAIETIMEKDRKRKLAKG